MWRRIIPSPAITCVRGEAQLGQINADLIRFVFAAAGPTRQAQRDLLDDEPRVLQIGITGKQLKGTRDEQRLDSGQRADSDDHFINVDWRMWLTSLADLCQQRSYQRGLMHETISFRQPANHIINHARNQRQQGRRQLLTGIKLLSRRTPEVAVAWK